jgi:hypothetical protein
VCEQELLVYWANPQQFNKLVALMFQIGMPSGQHTISALYGTKPEQGGRGEGRSVTMQDRIL